MKKIIKDFQIFEKKLNKELDEKLIKEFYDFIGDVVLLIINNSKDLISQNLSKDLVNSFNKRIDALNKRYETAKNPEILRNIQIEISEIYDRMEK